MGKLYKRIYTGHKKPRVMTIDINISEFKARCSELLDEVRLMGTRIRMSQLGQTIAEIVPVQPAQDRASWIASMKDSFEITGILSPQQETEMSGTVSATETSAHLIFQVLSS